jgi:hypothetical protein
VKPLIVWAAPTRRAFVAMVGAAAAALALPEPARDRDPDPSAGREPPKTRWIGHF